MRSLYDIKRRARSKVHDQFRVPAFYYATGPGGGYVKIHVRDHSSTVQTGTLPGDDIGYATQTEAEPKLVFDLNEVQPKRSAMVALRPGVVYAISSLEPSDGRFQVAKAERQHSSTAAAFEAPEDPYG